MEFRRLVTMYALVAEYTNCAVDPKHTVVLVGVWINAVKELNV